VELTDRARIAKTLRETLARVDGNVSRAVFGRTMLFISVIACFLVIVVVGHVSHVERSLLKRTALEEAVERLREVDQFRAVDLSSRVPPDDARAYKSNPHTSAAAAPPVPGTFEFSLADRLMHSTDAGVLRVYSPYPFPSNPKGGLPDKFAALAWNVLRDNPGQAFYRFTETDGRDSLRYAVAEVMRPQCVSCHNQSPWTPKRDWKIGDVAGVLEVEVPRQGATLLARSTASDTLILLTLLTGSTLGCIAFLVNRLKRRAAEAHRLALGTDEINRALEHEIEHRARAEKALSAANERLSTNHAQLERWAADLEVAHSRLRQIDELKTKFLSEVSHELRYTV
jgi:adenylate cyclase